MGKKSIPPGLQRAPHSWDIEFSGNEVNSIINQPVNSPSWHPLSFEYVSLLNKDVQCKSNRTLRKAFEAICTKLLKSDLAFDGFSCECDTIESQLGRA